MITSSIVTRETIYTELPGDINCLVSRFDAYPAIKEEVVLPQLAGAMTAVLDSIRIAKSEETIKVRIDAPNVANIASRTFSPSFAPRGKS